MIDRIVHQNQELALIIRHDYRKEGIEFFTPATYSQQIGYMSRPAGHVIPPHVHNPVPREVQFTKEVLVIRSGRLRVDFYSDAQEYLESTILDAGDIILSGSLVPLEPASAGDTFEMTLHGIGTCTASFV